MATFRKRGGNVNVQIRVKNHALISATFPTLDEARSWAVIEEAKLKQGNRKESFLELSRRANKIILGDALKEYGEYASPLSHHSKLALKHALKRGVAEKQITKITRQDALAVKADYLSEFSPGTASKYIHYFKRTIDYIIEDRNLQEFPNVFKGILHARDKKRWVRFTPEEEARFMKCAPTQLLKDFVSFNLETAMRRGEILRLRPGDIIDIDHGKGIYIPETKTHRPRIIPATKKALTVLERRPITNGLFFDIDGSVLSRSFKKACADANLLDKRIHDLRHEALSRLSALGLNTFQLMQISGHCDVRCLSIYVNGTISELAQKMATLSLDTLAIKA